MVYYQLTHPLQALRTPPAAAAAAAEASKGCFLTSPHLLLGCFLLMGLYCTWCHRSCGLLLPRGGVLLQYGPRHVPVSGRSHHLLRQNPVMFPHREWRHAVMAQRDGAGGRLEGGGRFGPQCERSE